MSEPVTFSSLNLSPEILKSVEKLGYVTPSEIQAQCIPFLLNGKDVLGLAQTGTGKTAAFALPLLNNIDATVKHPQVLVLAPTRELAIQVAEAFEQYAQFIKGINVLALYGGQSYNVQLSGLRNGPQVIVATPGRLIDHLNRGTIKFDHLKALVLDEADEMLRMGFIEDVETIMAKTPKQKQTCLFSATMPQQIQKICSTYLEDAEHVHISARNSTVESVEQVYWQANTHKNNAIIRFLQAETYDGAIVFVRTRNDTVEIAELLEQAGFSAAPLNGDMNQQARERTVERLKNGLLDIVIATDVAARGLDVDRLSLVINYDIPQDSEAYVHRIGRTGRAGRTGKAILFVKHNERHLLRNIIQHTKSTINNVDMPSTALVEEKRIQQLAIKVAASAEQKDILFYNELAEKLSEQLGLVGTDLAGALLYLAQQSAPIKVKEVAIHREARNDRDGKSRERSARPERDGRARREERAPREPRRDSDKPRERRNSENGPMDTYRIDIGREHGVQVKNIVGAIANEADIPSKFIGDIRLFDDHSTVQLPLNMPAETLQHFKKVFICKRPMNLVLHNDKNHSHDKAHGTEKVHNYDKPASANRAKAVEKRGPRAPRNK
ncbi:DEAD/DEAH box helicase [Pseudoalteromonas tunicata]|jgi:ATP-dependent RNA helicase DeaD|uniref:ATP-dependent RNA helicase DeaD n=1 Tax=Pseudoalteromonas tunicata D2 TaxID=87626 RepID=A4CCU7_9GAMM|nr:DEAD/DEAH box helicase [Pseudoalteromonas tunicata]ATC93896.1 ATP-dependent RNA helicase DeaD [Pseudoalteromonas tunicata]AXT29698.1 ATP-dependent helicase [Pseudoalteromonas tunicata]EAR27390.1 ATP-dependent RNA helicase, cold shock protein A [Pseudoalteromonas tunicata D2]MDP4984405.1 DEAD/DEAH box helicase [Pseudoalteromonas tunicata]